MEKIGQEGKAIHLSQATRALNITPDPDLLAKHDVYAARHGKTARKWAFAAALCVLGGIALVRSGHWIWATCLFILCVIFGILFLLFRGLSKGSAYESGLLICAMVIQTSPIKIAAMADMSASESEDGQPHYGMKILTIPTLPLHRLAVGERVPCVAMFGGSHNDLHANFEPRPIAWGIGDKETIAKATAAIEESEWLFLEKIKTAVTETPEDQVAYFDSAGSLIEVR